MGGHLTELMQLKSIFKDYDYKLVTEKHKSTVGLKACLLYTSPSPRD